MQAWQILVLLKGEDIPKSGKSNVYYANWQEMTNPVKVPLCFLRRSFTLLPVHHLSFLLWLTNDPRYRRDRLRRSNLQPSGSQRQSLEDSCTERSELLIGTQTHGRLGMKSQDFDSPERMLGSEEVVKCKHARYSVKLLRANDQSLQQSMQTLYMTITCKQDRGRDALTRAVD